MNAELQAVNPIHLIMKKCICILAAILFASVAFATNDPEPLITRDNGIPVLKPRDEEKSPLTLSWFWSLFDTSAIPSFYYEDDGGSVIYWSDMLPLPEGKGEE